MIKQPIAAFGCLLFKTSHRYNCTITPLCQPLPIKALSQTRVYPIKTSSSGNPFSKQAQQNHSAGLGMNYAKIKMFPLFYEGFAEFL